MRFDRAEKAAATTPAPAQETTHPSRIVTGESDAHSLFEYDFSTLAIDVERDEKRTAPGPECAFRLTIGGKEYCFNVVPDSKKPSLYKLLAAAPDKHGKYGIVYSRFVSVSVVKGKRAIVSPEGPIELTGYKQKTLEPVTIVVDPDVLVAAWDAAMPAETNLAKRPWDFVVLIVHDKAGKSLPSQIVFWMGEPGEPGDGEKKRVATFDVDRPEVDALRPKGTTEGLETLTSDDITKLVSSRTPRRTSLEGFSDDYIGRMVHQPIEVKTKGATELMPFDQAAGKPAPKGNMYRKSLYINPPPTQLSANFERGQFTVPGGLTAESRAGFDAQIELVLLYLDSMTDVAIKLYGDTDTFGNAKENLDLSQKRVNAVRSYLTDATRWTAPPAIATERIIEAVGRGQTEAEKDLKAKHPSGWSAFLGTEAPEFRRIVIEYNER